MNKEAKRIYLKGYYVANKEKIKAQSKAWWKANPEKAKAKNKTYYEANKERLKTQRKSYLDVNPGYYEKHNRAWRKANPEKHREKSRRRRALECITQVEYINDKIVYLRDGWICQHCKKRVDKRFKHPNPMSASLDHIIPLSKGGTHTYRNVQLVHLGCNTKKGVNVLPQGEQRRLF